MNVKIPPSWKKVLSSEFEKKYFVELTNFVKQQYLSNIIFPFPKYIFRAFDECDFDNVKVIILGQDPYHTPGVADGLAFSTLSSNKVPPSLQNIFKEISSEYGIQVSNNPDLSRWAKQGVLLLNSTLTVTSGIAGSHQKKGWEIFTDEVIKKLSDEKEHLVFMLWGNFAKSKSGLIDDSKHLILTSPHPSPFSAYSGFFGNNHFKLCNDYLASNGITEIDWQ